MIEQADLFITGTEGYHTYRIPALIVTQAGTVLAFCEARRNNGRDDDDIDLALKRSDDHGRTWSDRRIILHDGNDTTGNPCVVIDASRDTIWMLLCRNNRRVFHMHSTDDGQTWSDPEEISEQVVDSEWPWIGTGPGHGIQLQGGRLLIPCWEGQGEGFCGDIQRSFAIYSEDGAMSWKRSAAMDRDLSDECEAVELTDGSVYMNMRSRQDRKQRAYSLSADGGVSWSPVQFDERLPERSCQGSIVRLICAPESHRNRILFCCPSDLEKRACLTVRMSYDEGESWPVSRVLYPGSAAYSNLAVTTDGHLLCLFEADEYTRLILARFDLEWLTDGNDSLG